MEALKDVFSKIGNNIKDEQDGRWSYIVLKNVEDPQFNAKKAFPNSIGHSRRGPKVINVQFKSPEDAEAASKKKLKNVTIELPSIKVSRKRSSPGALLKWKPSNDDDEVDATADETTTKHIKMPHKHSWKLTKDVKILIRRHVKSLKEKLRSIKDDEKSTVIYTRELKFLQGALSFMHERINLAKLHEDYFEHHEEANSINFIKKARVSLETQIQERLVTMEGMLRELKREQIPAKGLRRSYYVIQVLMRYFRGEKAPKVEQRVLDLAEIKEEPVSADEDDGHEEQDEDVAASADEEEEGQDEQEEDLDESDAEEQEEEDEAASDSEDEEEEVVPVKKSRTNKK